MTGAAAAPAARQYRYYDLVMAAFVTVLLCANLIGAAKRTQVLGLTFTSGVLFFPISYIFGDILTEVYGYARARKVVWAGFGALGFASFMSFTILAFPPAPGWPHQPAYETVFGGTPRIVFASLIAYFAGEFCNSFVLAKHRARTNYLGRPGVFFGVQALVNGCEGRTLRVGDELAIAVQSHGLPGVPRFI